MTTLKFPLTKLPWVALRHTICTMSMDGLITYSLLSKKCNSLVKSLHLNTDRLIVRLGERQIQIPIGYGSEPVHMNFNYEEDVSKMPKLTMVTLEAIRLDLEKPAFKFREWLDYFMKIFNSKSITEDSTETSTDRTSEDGQNSKEGSISRGRMESK